MFLVIGSCEHRYRWTYLINDQISKEEEQRLKRIEAQFRTCLFPYFVDFSFTFRLSHYLSQLSGNQLSLFSLKCPFKHTRISQT